MFSMGVLNRLVEVEVGLVERRRAAGIARSIAEGAEIVAGGVLDGRQSQRPRS